MNPSEAVVYIPDDIDCDDGLDARRGVAHIERRGYRFAGVLRVWQQVLLLAAAGAVVVFARQEHAATVSQWKVKREFVGEETMRLIPIVQEDPALRAVLPSPRPRGRLFGLAAPFDESPTVPILDRWRAAGRLPRNDSPAERLVDDAARRWASENRRNRKPH